LALPPAVVVEGESQPIEKTQTKANDRIKNEFRMIIPGMGLIKFGVNLGG